jgi:hypothetical protein
MWILAVPLLFSLTSAQQVSILKMVTNNPCSQSVAGFGHTVTLSFSLSEPVDPAALTVTIGVTAADLSQLGGDVYEAAVVVGSGTTPNSDGTLGYSVALGDEDIYNYASGDPTIGIDTAPAEITASNMFSYANGDVAGSGDEVREARCQPLLADLAKSART